jgi:Ca-activated chloride channel family protein
MFDFIDLRSFSFASPPYLWLLFVPATLGALWVWLLARRAIEARRFANRRVVPERERFALVGELGFWLCIVVAAALCIVALAQPQARISVVKRASADIVLLQDASASMYVTDVYPNRWQRSQQFVRALVEAVSWEGDRMALALFASRASPQLRLTQDPNALLFFLDRLGERPPFPLESDTTWDTNIEEGLRWGLKLIRKDEEMFGTSRNARSFVVISDGQAWSGAVEAALAQAREQGIPVHVVGIGTTTGGMIPEPVGDDGIVPRSTRRAVLDRKSLRDIATAGGGRYFEIGAQPDTEVAFDVVSSTRDRAAANDESTSYEALYWHFLLAAAFFLGLAALCLRRRVELRWNAIGVGVSLLVLASVLS